MVYTYYARSFILQYYNAVRQTFLKFKINSRKELKSVALQAVHFFRIRFPFPLQTQHTSGAGFFCDF